MVSNTQGIQELERRIGELDCLDERVRDLAPNNQNTGPTTTQQQVASLAKDYANLLARVAAIERRDVATGTSGAPQMEDRIKALAQATTDMQAAITVLQNGQDALQDPLNDTIEDCNWPSKSGGGDKRTPESSSSSKSDAATEKKPLKCWLCQGPHRAAACPHQSKLSAIKASIAQEEQGCGEDDEDEDCAHMSARIMSIGSPFDQIPPLSLLEELGEPCQLGPLFDQTPPLPIDSFMYARDHWGCNNHIDDDLLACLYSDYWSPPNSSDSSSSPSPLGSSESSSGSHKTTCHIHRVRRLKRILPRWALYFLHEESAPPLSLLQKWPILPPKTAQRKTKRTQQEETQHMAPTLEVKASYDLVLGIPSSLSNIQTTIWSGLITTRGDKHRSSYFFTTPMDTTHRAFNHTSTYLRPDLTEEIIQNATALTTMLVAEKHAPTIVTVDRDVQKVIRSNPNRSNRIRYPIIIGSDRMQILKIQLDRIGCWMRHPIQWITEPIQFNIIQCLSNHI
ncbi:hypothetical protein G4B88_005678 [Cannabis sativa]|uniref:Uncharacterized protein n=1 Tax=Cannabis sativa TaxID=3483 RepID=A0A7J6EJM5_CANSA|nr:hypothetical protein G4B88_005678 [Cannabis sativa]